jgi:hypothetical protein
MKKFKSKQDNDGCSSRTGSPVTNQLKSLLYECLPYSIRDYDISEPLVFWPPPPSRGENGVDIVE